MVRNSVTPVLSLVWSRPKLTKCQRRTERPDPAKNLKNPVFEKKTIFSGFGCSVYLSTPNLRSFFFRADLLCAHVSGSTWGTAARPFVLPEMYELLSINAIGNCFII